MAKIKVITGAMRSGKSEETLKRLKGTGYKKKRILVIKPAEDNRTTRNIFQMIDDDKYLSSYKDLTKLVIGNFEDLKSAIAAHNPEVLVIDEAQFLDWLTNAIQELLDIHDRDENDDDFIMIVSGLDKDFLGNNFGPIPQLMVWADEVTKLSATCQKCEKKSATLTYKIGGSPNQQKEVGDDIYQARCRACHKLHE